MNKFINKILYTSGKVSKKKLFLVLFFVLVVLGGVFWVNRWDILSKEVSLGQLNGKLPDGYYKVTAYVADYGPDVCYNGGCGVQIKVAENQDGSGAALPFRVFNTSLQAHLESLIQKGEIYNFYVQVSFPNYPIGSATRSRTTELLDVKHVTTKKSPDTISPTMPVNGVNDSGDTEHNSNELPKTIEDAVRASGGTYMIIDPNTASPSDIADTMVDSGLTNSDGSGNITLKSGIKISDKLVSELAVKAYNLETKNTEKGEVVVHTNDLPIFVTLYDDHGAIFGTAREKNINGDYVIQWNFEKGTQYVVDLFINTEQIESYDNDASYQTTYTITYNNLHI